MPMLVLECNDAGLRLSDAGGLREHSPGFAALDGAEVVVGEAARRRARLHPQRAHHRYWYLLDQQPLDPPLGRARSVADLAWMQLSALRAAAGDDELLLAVPGSFSAAQLALLLGLCRAAALRAVGLVDSAIAALSTLAVDTPVLHVDVQLHRFWLTRVDADGDELRRSGGSDLAKPGLTAVWDAAAGVIGEQFVRQTRFDPLHSAATEQQLYDALPGWLEAFAHSAAQTLELDSGTRIQRAHVDRETVQAALRPLLGRVVAALRGAWEPGVRVVLSDRAAAVPGLCALLLAEWPAAPAPLLLPATAAASGALAHAAVIRSSEAALPWVTRLARRTENAPPAAAEAPAPTHLLANDVAVPLSPAAAARAGLRIERRGAHWWLLPVAGLQCNDAAVGEPRALRIGDCLRLAQRELRLIRVED
jgi:hypothetical protein